MDFSNLLSLPDDLFPIILLNYVQCTLDLIIFVKVKFCGIIKTRNEFPVYFERKPDDIMWMNYYQIIISSRLLPVYYHGDRIDYVPFHPEHINLTLYFLLPYISSLEGTVNIVLISDRLIPNVVIKYPGWAVDIRYRQYLEYYFS